MRHLPQITFLGLDQTGFVKSLLQNAPEIPAELSVLVAANLHNLAEVKKISFCGPTLLLSLGSEYVSIGPLHEPGKSVCFSCLHHWISTAGFDRQEQNRPPIDGAEILCELLHAAVSDYVSAGDIRYLRTAIHTVDLSEGRRSLHPIFPLRNCAACGDAKYQDWLGLRVHCSPLTGIVQKMELTLEPSAGAYRAVATWASPLPVAGKRPLLSRQESHGRGVTREQAELGCIGEALERYSLIFRGNEPLRRERLADIEGIDPRDILLYSQQQYATRNQWNRTADERYFVGEEFDPDRPIEWFPALDLVESRKAFMPAASTLMWYQFGANEPEFARADSIGCGSGWTFDDALAHALLEWIERDAMAIWWYNRLRRPSACLESFDMPELCQIEQALRRIGRELVLLDCTTDIGIPTYVSVAARFDGTEPLYAGAAHPCPRVAAWKAASEVGQLWFTMMHKKSIDKEIINWFEQTTATQRYLIPLHQIDASEGPTSMAVGDQIRLIIGQLKKVGLHPYAADLSRTDVTLKTVRAVVPGLRHIWNRRAPGRLYDVPVQLGWRDSPLKEEDLNSICCMI